EPQRLAATHRGLVQRRAERRRAHAAPRARRRAPDGRRGRAPPLPLGRGLGGAQRGGRAGRVRAGMSCAVSAEVADEHGLTREEWGRIVALLGRPPTLEELGVFAGLWSEPCSYKSSRAFGSMDRARTPYLVKGVVAGIGHYGNSIGVPTVGGEISFDPGYDHNILVNAFTLGVAPADRLFRARAAGVGNPVIYVGARTGRDGIHGASLLASAALDATSEEKRPAVQVGDPFTEKLLLEACLQLMQGDDIVAIQDMGAAGLTSSSVEMAGRGGMGIVLELDRVPLRA